MADVFVSYVSEDRAIARKIANALQDAGFSIWWDRHIRGGVEFSAEIERELAAARVVIVLWSAASQNSQWVRDEASVARDANKLIPIRIDGGQPPLGFRQLQLLEFEGWSGDTAAAAFADLLASLERFLGGPAAPAVPPTVTPNKRLRATKTRLLRSATAVVLIAGLFLGSWFLMRTWHDSRTARIQRATAVSEAQAFVKRDDYGAAFTRLRPFAKAQGSQADAGVDTLWKQIISPMQPLVAEAGATVYFKPYDDIDGEWLLAGTSPIETPVEAPKGVLRMRIEKPGYITREFAIANPGPSVDSASVDSTDNDTAGMKAMFDIHPVPLELSPVGALPDGFVRVPALNTPVNIVGLSLAFADGLLRPFPAFAIGRDEVTNGEFKAFVDAGGYDNPAYWNTLHFVDRGKALTWPEARARFVDRTGRAGPADWEVGTYPTGAADLPVGGISWYEAVAYARFRGLALPTVHHWARAAFGPFDEVFGVIKSVAAGSRFAADAPVAERPGMGLGPWGTVNTAGNVREWVWNFTGDLALAMGGSWTDAYELAAAVFPTPPFDRSPQNGLRVMLTLDSAPIEPDLLAPVELAIRNAATPVSDQEFEAMRFQFSAASRVPTHATTRAVDENDVWIAEEVTLDFAAGEPFVLYVIRPKGAKNSLQPVLYAPGVGAVNSPQPNENALAELRNVDFVVRGGRAIVMPIWSGTYGRFVAPSDDPKENFERLVLAPLEWHRDLITTLDYLATRPDIDSERVGIIGFSFGARFIVETLLAIEGRLTTAVLLSGGLDLGSSWPPMFDAINYAPRTVQPVLMINGRYDNVVPIAQAQRRYFDLLGTPPNDRRHVIYDCGHIDFPRNLEVAEVTDWLDRYLGPVRSSKVRS